MCAHCGCAEKPAETFSSAKTLHTSDSKWQLALSVYIFDSVRDFISQKSFNMMSVNVLFVMILSNFKGNHENLSENVSSNVLLVKVSLEILL